MKIIKQLLCVHDWAVYTPKPQKQSQTLPSGVHIMVYGMIRFDPDVTICRLCGKVKK